MYGLAVAEKYEREGKAAADYLSLLERTTRTRAYLFDGHGNEVAGREAPPKITEMTQALIAGTGDGFIQTARTAFVAKKVDAPGGKMFIVVSESRRPTGIGLPFWPRVWWAQSIALFLTPGIVCPLLARYLTSPVVKLRRATQQLAAGDLSASVGAANGRSKYFCRLRANPTGKCRRKRPAILKKRRLKRHPPQPIPEPAPPDSVLS